MRKTLIVSLCVLFAVASLSAVAFAKNTANLNQDLRPTVVPQPSPLPSDLLNKGPALSSAVADTFHLAWYEFDTAGLPDEMGWTKVDLTVQLKKYWHVASGTGELDGGAFGTLLPLEGNKSMWCGQAPSGAVPYCGWGVLPGYGNGWDQTLSTTTLNCDSVEIAYKIHWDSEPGYDFTYLEYYDANTNSWVDGSPTTYTYYGAEIASTGFQIPAGSTTLRFHFKSDGAWSGEDGLWPTDGGVTVDSISVRCFNGGSLSSSSFSDFESSTDGDFTDGTWTAGVPTPFGLFAALYPGVTVVQEDPCYTEFTNMWGFFDDPATTNYACGGWPLQGAMRKGPSADGLYLDNEIWSPLIANVGSGAEYRIVFNSYRDLPLDNLQFYIWSTRSWTSGCPSGWGNDNFVYYGGQKDWITQNLPVGSHCDPAADYIQVSLGAVDQCGVWCGIYGTGTCHSHAPLIDRFGVVRINVLGPQYTLRFVDMFQDNFATDGTLTGVARADGANDIKPGDNPDILPADSLVVTITGPGTDPFTGIGPRAYVWATVQNGGAGVAGTDMEATDVDVAPHASNYRNGNKRFPLVNTTVVGSTTWYQFRMDTIFTSAVSVVKDRFCFDFNDVVFTPGDTIRYFLGALDAAGNPTYVYRDLDGQGQQFNITQDINECYASPMEFTILPAGGYQRGGDILYVDGSDDRGGPAELYYDTAFDYLGQRDLIDRYDILAPSSGLSNGLAGRVKNIATQIMIPYRKIIWNSGNLNSALLGDGDTTPVKQDDFGLLYQFLDTHPSNPGLWISGDSNAQEWNGMGTSAQNMKFFMNFTLVSGNHAVFGEPISPTLTGVGPATTGLSHVAYGGCPVINDFDVLSTAGGAGTPVGEMQNAGSGQFYALSQATPNSAASTARVFLQGYSFTYIRDLGPPSSTPARVAFMRAVLLWLQNVIPNPIGIKDGPKLVNRLDNNYPNPFNPTTTITYSIKDQGHVSLKVYNAAGQLVRTLVDEMKTPQEAGFTVTWNGLNNAGSQVASGVYFYKLTTGNFTQTKKMVLLK
jgi:hypothetical protein